RTGDVADLVDLDAQAEVAHPRDEQVAARLVLVGERQAAHAPIAGVADRRQLGEPRAQAVGVDLHASAMSDGRTGTRGSSRPVAARMAATTAAPEEIVGASPTPLAPNGAPRCSSGSSIRAATRSSGRSSAVGMR